MLTKKSSVSIVFGTVKELSLKKREGWVISPDLIGRCVIGSLFDPTNGRGQALAEVEEVIDATDTDRFDELYCSLLKKYTKGDGDIHNG